MQKSSTNKIAPEPKDKFPVVRLETSSFGGRENVKSVPSKAHLSLLIRTYHFYHSNCKDDNITQSMLGTA